MAAARKLKVFVTPIGFHDAYVAAPSRKAALAAWGSDHDLFARGIAELVTDDALTAEPLARPGEVVKRLRGTTAEQIAALPPDTKPAEARPVAEKAPAGRRAKPQPRPSRAALDRMEAALVAAETGQCDARDALAEREAALRRERETLEQKQRQEMRDLEEQRDKAEREYRARMAAWEG